MINFFNFLSKIYNQIWLNLTLPFPHDQQHLWIQPKKNNSSKIHGHEWTGQKPQALLRCECQSLRRHLTQTNITASSNVRIFGGTHPRAPTSLAHSPSVRLSVRLIISCFSLLLTPHLEVRKIHLFSFCCTAGYTTFGPEPCNE